MLAPVNLRERKKRRTRKDLLRAATGLFAARGFDAVTTDDIALAADVSRRTLFRYFPTKEALVFADAALRLTRFRALLAERPPGETGFAAVRRALMAMAAEYMEDRDGLVARQRVIEASPTLLAAERLQDLEWEAAIAQVLRERCTAHPEREHWARVLAAAVFGVVRTVVREWVADGGRTDLGAVGRASLDLLADGFHLNGG